MPTSAVEPRFRYAGERTHGGEAFPDAGWPALPALSEARPASPALIEQLRAEWRHDGTS